MVESAHADVLLVTVTKVESQAVLKAFAPTAQAAGGPQSIGGRIYFDLGTVNGTRAWMTQCEMGAGGVGAAHQAVAKGIAALSPAAVIMVGIAFGVNEQKQHIGDVLVAAQLRLYDLKRVGEIDGREKIVLRGDKPHASSALINLLKSAELTWSGATVHFGPILAGETLVDNLDFREQLQTFEPEALGGEMEGAGLYVACADQKIDWILVKAICDWADGQKGQDKIQRQTLAANNAADFVRFAFQFVQIDWQAVAPRRAIRKPPAKSPEVELALRFEQMPRSTGDCHLYDLVVCLNNTGSKRLDDWEIVIEFPTPLLDGVIHAIKVAERSDARRSVFLVDGKKLSQPLRPGEARTVRLGYQVTNDTYWNRRNLFDEVVKTSALIDGEIVAQVERRFQELQNF